MLALNPFTLGFVFRLQRLFSARDLSLNFLVVNFLDIISFFSTECKYAKSILEPKVEIQNILVALVEPQGLAVLPRSRSPLP